MASMDGKINLGEKLASFTQHWSPRTVAQFNACDVMVVKVLASSSGTSTTIRTTFS
jgi:hypothetical protein